MALRRSWEIGSDRRWVVPSSRVLAFSFDGFKSVMTFLPPETGFACFTRP